MKTVWSEFLKGDSALGNRAYHPLQEDVATASLSGTDALFTKHIDKADAWKSVASRLTVEGMFNVNSTSYTAWRALLGHARNQRVPFQKQSGSAVSVSLSGKSDHVVSRFSVAGSPDATAAPDGGEFSAANEFTGYRLLNDANIDELANEVVNQVRARGPFLSLSEFVNRQLSSGDLALAGTLQAALKKLAENKTNSPFTGVSNLEFTKEAVPPPKEEKPEYQFEEAAIGNSAYGLPGWIRQADILRPIAPILTARDDTFTVRAYGDSRDKSGIIKARSVCEATVTRHRDYVDTSDAADTAAAPISGVNLRFGRSFKVISFRWLSPAEI